MPVGDEPGAPSLKVNGRKAETDDPAAEPPALCGVGQGPDGRDSTEGLNATIKELGIELPEGRGPGQEDRYVYLDANGQPQEERICFGWNSGGGDSQRARGNVMIISGLTPEFARMLDCSIDGRLGASMGRFRHHDGNTDVWPVAKDDGAVEPVTAHLQLNQ